MGAAAGLGACLVDPTPCLAEDEPGPSLSDYLPPSEKELTRDQWQQRIDQARQRAKEVSREHREHPELNKPVPEEPDLVAIERLRNEESLQQGDIVTTKKVAPKPGR